MNRKFIEELILFYSVIKWVVLSVSIGIIVGVSTTIFLKLLNGGIELTGNYKYFFLLMPLAFFVSVILTRYIAPDAAGHGTEKVIESVHKNNGKINPLIVPIKLIATVISISAGGSAGKEGPCAQIGGGLASGFSDIFRFNDNDRKKLVICGISAGFSSVFGTPVSGAIFGVEVLIIGSIMYDALLPSFIAGITAFQVSSFFGITYSYSPLSQPFHFNSTFFLYVLLAAVFFGICSFLFIELLGKGKTISDKIKIWAPLKGIIGGLLLIALTFIFGKQYLGLGVDTIDMALSGADIIWYTFIIKMIFTAITLSFGGSGGVITPIFFIGSTAGVLFADIFHLDRSIFASIGMVSLLAGAANTPISASVMAVELFGIKVAPYAAIACVISFLMTGYRSVFPSQKIGVRKSVLINVELGENINTSDIHYTPENERTFKKVIKILNKFKRK